MIFNTRAFATILRIGFVASVAGLAVAAAAQAYDPQLDPTGDGTRPAGMAGPMAGQLTGRNAATGQLAAPTAPAVQFRADDLTPNSRARAQPRTPARTPARTLDNTPEQGDVRIVASEFETYVSEIADKPLLRFGSALLVPDARGFTAPATTAVPLDYRLNPGDELIIGLTGSVQADSLHVTVDPEGRIFVPRVGAVTVGGLRYADVDRAIAAQVGRQYRDFHVAVSIGQLHGITVYVTGFAATPGAYSVSSLATLVDGVLAAGGPTTGGSFRSIELKRGGRTVSTFDLYDLLLRGDKSADVTLRNGDVIYIAPAGAQVAAIGSLNNEAIFEAKPGETLADVLRYAGGVSTVADDTRVLILDSFQTRAMGWTELAIDTLGTQPAKRGEVLRVLSGIGLTGPVRNQAVLVTVSGEVAKPGRYFMQPGVTLGEVVGQAGGLTSQAYPFASVITRESVRQQQKTSFQRAVADLQLALTTQPLVTSVPGLMLQPARLQAVQSLVAQLSARKPDGRLVLDLAPAATALPLDLILENNDTVLVRPIPVAVGVFGAVASPASFLFAGGTTVGAYLARAGGTLPVGDSRHIIVIRANGAVAATRHGNGMLKEPVLPGDLIFVPINAGRGEFWAKVRDLTSTLFSGILGGAAVASLVK